MSEPDLLYSGSVPRAYHEGLGPMFFEPYARDIARRLTLEPGARVLETAAGTGIVTRQLLARLPLDGQLVATDIGEPMLAVAEASTPHDQRLEWRTADACALPFPDDSFDAFVCQFGLMFFSDQIGALREARRVVRSGKPILLSVWASLADNPIARIAHETIGSFFPADPPRFYEKPWGLHDEARVQEMFRQAGFEGVVCDTVDMTGESVTAELAARGLVIGSPVSTEIADRDPSTLDAITRAIAERLTATGGQSPMRLPMRARVFTATA